MTDGTCAGPDPDPALWTTDAGVTGGPDAVPPAVAARLADRPEVPAGPARVVWRNDLGGRTWALGDPPGAYLKLWPGPGAPSLAEETARLAWLAGRVAVPELLDSGPAGAGWWTLTRTLPGTSAVDARWRRDPDRLATALGLGLRRFHDALPVADCPFDAGVGVRVADARRRAGGLDPARWHPEHRSLTVEQALARSSETPPVDLPVVCHGDPCVPNHLLGGDGEVVGHVDVGACGVADRWADLAVATWSLDWNLGPGHQGALLAAYGVAPRPGANRLLPAAVGPRALSRAGGRPGRAVSVGPPRGSGSAGAGRRPVDDRGPHGCPPRRAGTCGVASRRRTAPGSRRGPYGCRPAPR